MTGRLAERGSAPRPRRLDALRVGEAGKGDLLFAGGVAAIAALGVLFVYSASCYTAELQYGDEFYFLKKQLLGFVLGLVALILISRIDLSRRTKLGVPALIAALVLLAAVFIPGLGKTSYGATRWLGLGPVTIQPSELAKFSFVLFAAGHFARDPARPRTFPGILPVLGAGVSLSALILLEPNLSVTMVMGALMLGMLFLAGMPLKRLALLVLPVLAALPLLILAEPYRLRRLTAFLDPWSSPQDEGYQLIQSLYALANGNLFGVGLFRSRQKYRFLPFAESDFILSVIAEETGFFGVVCLFALIGFVVWRGFRIAARARTFYEYLLVSGIVFAFAVQAALNALVVSGCVPPTGLPLPLVSAGNTSLIVTMAGMGVVFGVSRRSGRA